MKKKKDPSPSPYLPSGHLRNSSEEEGGRVGDIIIEEKYVTSEKNPRIHRDKQKIYMYFPRMFVIL